MTDFSIKITVWWDVTPCNPLIVTMDQSNYRVVYCDDGGSRVHRNLGIGS